MQFMVCIGNYNGFHVECLYNHSESTDKAVYRIKTNTVVFAPSLLIMIYSAAMGFLCLLKFQACYKSTSVLN